MDTSYFHVLKESWRETVPKWKIEHNVMRLRREQFPSVLKISIDNIKNEKKIIQNGFRSCGLYPFDVNALNFNALKKEKKKKSAVTESNPVPKILFNEDSQRHVETFQKNLSLELLEEFKNSENSVEWQGDIKIKGLFDYWLQIKRGFTGT